jgi:hypothetical protein
LFAANKGSGIYLENGSRNNEVTSSIFVENGFTQMKKMEYKNYNFDYLNRYLQNPGQFVQQVKCDVNKASTRQSDWGREALAIDSSAGNVITGNAFIKNRKGGVFLYKNCWEKHSNPNSRPRFQWSSFNDISHNFFSCMPRGVWIASRQSTPLQGMECGDTEIYSSGEDRYYKDFAKDNIVNFNRFHDIQDVGIKIEDDRNSANFNQFFGTRSLNIDIGKSYQESHGEYFSPVKESVVVNNSYKVSPDLPKWEHASVSISRQSQTTTFLTNSLASDLIPQKFKDVKVYRTECQSTSGGCTVTASCAANEQLISVKSLANLKSKIDHTPVSQFPWGTINVSSNTSSGVHIVTQGDLTRSVRTRNQSFIPQGNGEVTFTCSSNTSPCIVRAWIACAMR